MRDIIIIGTSKAGFLHLNSYRKMENIGNIYFVDILGKSNNTNINVDKVWTSVSEIVFSKRLNTNQVIADLCIPKEEFGKVIKECLELGIYKIIVEKPLFVESKLFQDYPNLDLLMVQNYLYSKITRDLVNILRNQAYKIKFIYCNFSKNRIKDSCKGRGISKKATMNFEIEMPHEIYLLLQILGDSSTIEILSEVQQDFVFENKIWKDHGYGRIVCKSREILCVLESDLCTNISRREVLIICNDGISLRVEYLQYDSNLNITKKGRLVVEKNNKVIYVVNYENDDNMYECLLEYYQYLNAEVHVNTYKNRILDFSAFYKKLHVGCLECYIK